MVEIRKNAKENWFMIVAQIRRILKRAAEKSWDKTYWAFDIHETIIESNWAIKPVPTTFYPLAKSCLQNLSKRSEVVLFLYTCSHPHEIEIYLELFKQNDIHFKFVNENPEVLNFKYGYYEKKPYFNLLFEDKAGFDPHIHWKELYDFLQEWK